MPICNRCYETDPAQCVRCGNPALDCSNWIANPTAEREATGDYSPGLRNALPPQVRRVDGHLLDNLMGVDASALNAPAGLTPQEAAIAADMNVLDMTNLNMALTLVRKRPNVRIALENRIAELVMTASAGDVRKLDFTAKAIERAAEMVASLNKEQVKTVRGFLESNYPRATLFQTIIKSVVKGTEIIEDSSVMLELSSGKKMVPFEKATKVTSGEQLVYAVHLYITTLQQLTKEVPKATYDFMRDVSKVTESKGYKFAQAYVDAMLRYLDEKRYDNVVSLYRAGEHTRIYIELDAEMGTDTQKDKDPAKSRFKIKQFGPVTKPIGGEGAGVIARPCTKFHADPKQACTAGVPANEGFPADKVGLCAYCH